MDKSWGICCRKCCCNRHNLGFMAAPAMRESPLDAANRFQQFDQDEPKSKLITDLQNSSAVSKNILKNHTSHKKFKTVLTDGDVNTLKTKGIVVIDNVLSIEELRLVRLEVNALVNKGNNRSITNLNVNGFNINDQEDLLVRTDQVMWISEIVSKEQQSNIIGQALMQTLRQVRAIPYDLKSHGMIYDDQLLGVPFVNQLACYDGKGSNYIAHRDSPEEIIPGQVNHPLRWLFLGPIMERELTIIIYLNEHRWDSNAGELSCSENLRCYLNTADDDMTGESAAEVLNIEPIGGRMVIFDARKILHEVMPSHQRRLASTCWVGGRHSVDTWLRVFCIPYTELDWSYIYKKYIRCSFGKRDE